MLRKILDRVHPLGLVGSMWATAGAEQAGREIKKAKSFGRTLLPPHGTHTQSAPIFPYYRKQKGGKGAQYRSY